MFEGDRLVSANVTSGMHAVRRCQKQVFSIWLHPKRNDLEKGVRYNRRYQFLPAGVFAISESISAWVCAKSCASWVVHVLVSVPEFLPQKEFQILEIRMKRHRHSGAFTNYNESWSQRWKAKQKLESQSLGTLGSTLITPHSPKDRNSFIIYIWTGNLLKLAFKNYGHVIHSCM